MAKGHARADYFLCVDQARIGILEARSSAESELSP